MLLHEHQCAHNHHDRYGQKHAVSANRLWSIPSEFRPRNHQWGNKKCQHCRPGFPDSESARRRSFRHSFCFHIARQKTNAHKPCHGRDQRHVKHASRVIEVQIDGLTRDQRSHAVGQTCRKKMKIDRPPFVPASPPDQQQARGQREFFAHVQQIETAAVRRFHRMHVLPRDHDKQVKEEPPRQQQGEIERIHADAVLIVLHMRQDGQRGHHGHDM